MPRVLTQKQAKTDPKGQQHALTKRREKAIVAIKKHRKSAVIGPPMTIEEIISARDEGRRY